MNRRKFCLAIVTSAWIVCTLPGCMRDDKLDLSLNASGELEFELLKHPPIRSVDIESTDCRKTKQRGWSTKTALRSGKQIIVYGNSLSQGRNGKTEPLQPGVHYRASAGGMGSLAIIDFEVFEQDGRLVSVREIEACHYPMIE